MTELVLAIDLGTSSTKLLAVDRRGGVVDRRHVPHETLHPTPEAAEQDPAAWWRNIRNGVRSMARLDARVAAIGVTGQMHGLVLHDDSGRSLRPAISWQDRRSAATLPGLRGRLPAEAGKRLAPGFQAASWHWLTIAEPETAAKAARVLLPKDEIVYRLTGERVTDPSDAVGTGWYDPITGDWNDAVLDAARAERRMLPAIAPSGSIAGRLTPGAAGELGLAAGIPLMVAGGDAAVAAFGAGASEATPLLMLSTGCQALQPSRERPASDAWPSAGPQGMPRWLRVAATLNGGNAVRWARETFGEPAGETHPDIVFLPYLAGERSVEVAGDAAGAFLGLRAHHDRGAMSRAALDGVAMAIAARYTAIGGEVASVDPVLAGGGGVRDEAWLASVARVFGRPLRVIDEPDLSAWGAARSAATALGWIDPIADPKAWVPANRLIEAPSQIPDAVRARLERFRELSRRLYGDER